MTENDDTARFILRDGEADPESMYVADAENLRIEKLSTRVTLVAVLIPCLLVIVLAIAYLDIKKRVIRTQNTGSMGVQNLAKDLESRFSNLSLKQAKMEVQLAAQEKKLDDATAAVQVNLKKTTDTLRKKVDEKPDRSALATLSRETEASMAALKKDIDEVNRKMGALRKEMKALGGAFNKFDDELAGQILLMAKGLKKDQGRFSSIEKKIVALDSEKLSKEAMNLAIGLERLALQEMLKERIGAVEKKIATLTRQVEKLKRNQKAQARPAAPSSSAAPKPAATPPPSGPADGSGIVEQTIN